MQTTRTEAIKQTIASTAAKAYVGFKSGEYNTTRSKMKTSLESLGVIESILVVNKTVYVIASRVRQLSQDKRDHNIVEYFNCAGDLENYSPFELLMPITNIDLSRDVLDPRILIKGKVLVSEINGQAAKCEFVGELEELNESPLAVPRALLQSFRNFLGAGESFYSKEERVTDLIQQFGLSDIVDDLYEHKASDWAGNVITYNSEGDYTMDSTGRKQSGRVTIKPMENLTRHLTGTTMKSKMCHLPVKLFSAR